MGDLNSVDLAQETHESILREAGCFRESQTLRFSGPMPMTGTLEGVYVDDHVVLGIVDRDRVGDRTVGSDFARVLASREAYQKAGLPTAEKENRVAKTLCCLGHRRRLRLRPCLGTDRAPRSVVSLDSAGFRFASGLEGAAACPCWLHSASAHAS